MKRIIRLRTTAATNTTVDEILDKPGHLIRLAHQKSVALFEAAFSEFGVTVGQQMVLVALFKHGSCDLTSIAQIVTWDRSTTGDVVSRLSRRGLVRATSSPRDQRVKLIALTSAGRSLLLKMAPAIRAAQDKLLEHLAPEERVELNRLLRKIVDRSAGPSVQSPSKTDGPLAGQTVALFGPHAALRECTYRRLTDRGANVSVISPEHIGQWGQTVDASTRKLIVFAREWPGKPASAANELQMFLKRDLPLLADLFSNGASGLHVVAGLMLMPDQAPGQIETAAAMKRALVALTNRPSTAKLQPEPTLAAVICGTRLEAGQNELRSTFLSEVEDTANAIIAAAEMRPKRRAVIFDRAPEF